MYGQLKEVAGGWQLRFTRVLNHSPEKVWRALVEPEHLEAWFPTTIEGEREVGAALRFSFRQDEAPPMKGQMIVYEPHSLLEFKWGEDTLRFELKPEGDSTRLTLLDTFDEMGRGARDAAGWHVCLDSLERHLAGERPSGDPKADWKSVHAEYVERLGPEASTIGPFEDST
jgi:uncharacterized protein YndB with AHSA1/START domain